MSIVVGIDPSLTSCGIAVLRSEDPTNPFPSNVTLKSVGHPGTDADDWADRSARIVSQARLVLSTVPSWSAAAVIEGPAYGQNLPSTHDRAGLWWGIVSGLIAMGVPTAVCAPQSRAKWITGKGTAKKVEVLAAVRAQWAGVGVRPRNHDEADALGLAAIGALKLGWNLPFEIKDRHHIGIDAVAWPKENA